MDLLSLPSFLSATKLEHGVAVAALEAAHTASHESLASAHDEAAEALRAEHGDEVCAAEAALAELRATAAARDVLVSEHNMLLDEVIAVRADASEARVRFEVASTKRTLEMGAERDALRAELARDTEQLRAKHAAAEASWATEHAAALDAALDASNDELASTTAALAAAHDEKLARHARRIGNEAQKELRAATAEAHAAAATKAAGELEAAAKKHGAALRKQRREEKARGEARERGLKAKHAKEVSERVADAEAEAADAARGGKEAAVKVATSKHRRAVEKLRQEQELHLSAELDTVAQAHGAIFVLVSLVFVFVLSFLSFGLFAHLVSLLLYFLSRRCDACRAEAAGGEVKGCGCGYCNGGAGAKARRAAATR